MSIEVFTQTQCDRCGYIKEIEGSHPNEPPEGWGRNSLIITGEKAGWPDSKSYSRILCPDCVRDCLVFMRKESKEA